MGHIQAHPGKHLVKKLNKAATQDATQWKGGATSVGTGLLATCPQFWFNVDMTSHAAFIDWITMLAWCLAYVTAMEYANVVMTTDVPVLSLWITMMEQKRQHTEE